MDGARPQCARGERRRDPGDDAAASAPADVRGGRHVRHELRVRLRLPARQHGLLARGVRPARPRLRHRRRGRQHPDRRGADPAHHLGSPRAGGRHVRHLRPPRQADGRRGGGDEAEVPWRVPRHLRGRSRLRVRREAQDRRPNRGRSPQGRAVPRRREPLHVRERHAGQPPDPVPQGREALQEGHRLRGHRRPGDDHRRVHRSHPRRPPLVRGPPPGNRGQGGRPRPRGEPDARDDHASELLPPLREALRHDGHRDDRGPGVHEDLRDAGGRDPDPPPDGPRRRERPDLQDEGRQVEGPRQRDQGAQREGPADPDRDHLRRGFRDARRRVQAQRDRPRCPERKARARPARGRDDLAGRAPRRRHDRDEHGGPRRRHQARRRPRGHGPGGREKAGPQSRRRGL